MRCGFFLAVLACAFFSEARADTVLVLPFSNLSKDVSVDWIGESVSESIREALATEGVVALGRGEREEAYRRLSLRRDALLTTASVIKIGQVLDADQVVFGQFELTPPANQAPATSKGSLRLAAHILDLKLMKQGPEYGETGAVEELASIEGHLAWQTLQFLTPKTAPSETEFRAQRPALRLDAIENYVRGLLATSPEQKHRYFTQAARLDDRFSQPCFQLGRLLWEKKEYRAASEWLQKVRPNDPHYREANYLLGLCRYSTADYAAAQTSFTLVAQTVPLNEVWNNLAATQSRRNLPDAVENFRKAVEGDPSDPDYHFNLGYALWKKGDFGAAADEFRAVLERKREDAQAMALLGKCLNRAGPRPGDPKTEGLERLKQNYEETAYLQLKAELEPKKK